jgi:hypothetical protein
MCLLTTQSKALRAKEDIPVYKMFYIPYSGRIESPYKQFVYKKLGRQKTIKFVKQKGRGDSFSTSDSFQASNDERKGKTIYTISEGYHSCKLYVILSNTSWGRFSIKKCIIPKGSWYYEGYDGLMVSTDLIIPEDEFKTNK